jgi:RILP-like protein 1
LHSQIENLTSMILNFRRKQILAQNQIEKLVKGKAELECQLTDKDHQLNLIREKLHVKSIQSDDLEAINQNRDENENRQRRQSQLSDNADASRGSISTTDMLIIDAKDPNRPRFTLKELQKVLMEKNQLTVKLDQTKDELEYLRKQ